MSGLSAASPLAEPLQAKAAKRKVPDDLCYGYVFLADPDTQSGIDKAGQRINQIQTAYAKVSGRSIVMNVDGRQSVHAVDPSGQISLFLPDATGIWVKDEPPAPASGSAGTGGGGDLLRKWASLQRRTCSLLKIPR